MDEKILTKHPDPGKQGVSISKVKQVTIGTGREVSFNL